MAKFKLKRKTFAFLGIGNVAKNWKVAERLWKTNKSASILAGSKALGTGTLYTLGGAAALGTAGAAVGAKKAADTITGEDAANKMEFSN